MTKVKAPKIIAKPIEAKIIASFWGSRKLKFQ